MIGKPFTAESHRHTAAVCRTEAEVRRQSPHAHQREFAAVLDTWAANAEARALALDTPSQRDLFDRSAA